MSETIFYIKQGRRYIPHSVYSKEFCDGFTNGSHLVNVKIGGVSRRFNIDPEYAPLIAAGLVAEDAISSAMISASTLQRKNTNKPLTAEQQEAWKHLIEVFGEDANSLTWPSVREITQSGVLALIKEADKLMEYPSVKKAYDNFLLMCKLTKENTID